MLEEMDEATNGENRQGCNYAVTEAAPGTEEIKEKGTESEGGKS